MERRRLFLLLSALGVGACSTSETTATGVTPLTAIAVDPAQFIGDVKCGEEAGDMVRFVATLSDVSPHGDLGIGSATLILPSSAPTSCHVPVLFEGVLVGHEYQARVDGYDRENIAPLAKGSSSMVVSTQIDGAVPPDVGAYVPPRWTTTCGSHRLPPSLRGDGGQEPADAGSAQYVDGGYDSCRPVVRYGPNDTPWLDGPVCALTQLTITVRGCDALQQAP